MQLPTVLYVGIHTHTTNTRMTVPHVIKEYADIYFEGLHTLYKIK